MVFQYGGDKQLSVFEGDHNSSRPEAFRQHARDFLVECFLVSILLLLHEYSRA